MRIGISPVLATVILIAITLIAAIAIAGFVFGLFGAFANPPSIHYHDCIANGTTFHGNFSYGGYKVDCP